MTGEVPQLLPSTFDFQTGALTANPPVRLPQEPEQVHGRGFHNPPDMPPGDRLQWLIDQNARASRARDVMLGNPPRDMEDYTVDAINRSAEAFNDETHGEAFKDWLLGRQQRRFKETHDRVFLETGDAMAALGAAQRQHGYIPPMLTLEADPALLHYDPATLQELHGAGKSAFRDWVVEPVSRVGFGLMQGMADTGTGLLNLFGAGIRHHDIRARLAATMRLAGGEQISAEEAERQEELAGQAYEGSRDWIARILQAGGTGTGTLLSLTGGPAGLLLKAGGKAGAVAGEAAQAYGVGEKTAKAIELGVRGATGFGLLNFVSAQGKDGAPATFAERLKAGGIGALLGPIYETAGAIGKAAFRGILARGMQNAASQDGKIATKVLDWASGQGISRGAQEGSEDYLRRVVDGYMGAGMPGSHLYGTRIAAVGAQSMIEAVGLSAVDHEFAKDIYDGIFTGDGKALLRAAEKMLGTGLGLAFVHYGGSFARMKDEMRRQTGEQHREDVFAEGRREDAVATEAAKVQKQETVETTQEAADVERAAGEGMVEPEAREVTDLQRQGWAKDPEAEGRVSLQDSPYAYSVEGDVARPSPKLRSALGLPESLPLQELEARLAKAGTLSALQSKALLPGEEITHHGWVADVDSSKIRTVRLGEVVERPLDPEGKWGPAEGFEPRKPDPIPEPQQQVAEAVEKLGEQMRAPGDAALHDGVTTVLKTVSMEKDTAVAETVEAIQSGVLDDLSHQDPAKAIQVIGDMLTTKAPEVVLHDLNSIKAKSSVTPPPETEFGTGERRIRGKASESGHILLPGGRDRSTEREGERGSVLTDIGGAIMRGVGRVFDNPATRFFSADVVERAKRVSPEFGAEVREALAKQHGHHDELQGDIADVKEAAKGGVAESLKGRIQSDRVPDFEYEETQVYSEDDLMQRFQVDRSRLTAEQQRLLATTDKANADTRATAHRLGFVVRNVKGTPRVAETTERHVQTRQLTSFGRRAFENQEFISDLATEEGVSVDQMEKMVEDSGFSDSRTMHVDDALENKRAFKYLPSHWRGERILVTDPVRHTESMVRSFAIRAGMHEQFGPDRSGSGEPTYNQVVSQFKLGKKRDAIKVMQQLSGQNEHHLTPFEERLHDFLRPLQTGLVGAALTSPRSVAQNLTETFGQGAAILGIDNVAAAHKEVLSAMTRPGGLRQLIDDVAQEGGWKPNFGHTGAEGAQGAADTFFHGVTTLFRFSQNLSDLTNRVAAGRLVEQMEAGNGGRIGRRFAETMDFSPQDAQRLAQGGGTPEEYQSLIDRVLPRISGRGQLPGDRSRFSEVARRGFIPFLGYAEKFAQNLQRIGAKLRAAQTPQDRADAGIELMRFLGLATVSTGLGAGLYNLLFKGPKEATDRLAEAAQNPVDSLLTGIVGQAFGGVGQTASQGLTALWNDMAENLHAPKLKVHGQMAGDKEEFFDHLIGTVAPLRLFNEIRQALTTSGPYSGLGPAGAGYMLGKRLFPALRDVDRGALMGHLPITTDPQVVDSRSKLSRWKDRQGIEEDFGKQTENSELMRSFELELRKPGAVDNADLQDLADRIVESQPKDSDKTPTEWRRMAQQSLLARRNFNPEWFNKLTQEQVADMHRYMGEGKMATLRGYDEALEQLAKLVYPEFMHPGRSRRR